MNAAQLELEQALLHEAEASAITLRRLYDERNAYKDALEKIAETRLIPVDFEEKCDRVFEIAEEVLGLDL